MRNSRSMILLLVILLVAVSCLSCHRSPRRNTHYNKPVVALSAEHKQALEQIRQKPKLERMGYTIQAGAFRKVENAFRLTELLKERGLDATYFLASDKLFKVRFGNFTTREAARQRAVSLKDAGIIEEFYIVQPEEYSVALAEKRKDSIDFIRNSLVKTAKDFIGVPYLWGGQSTDDGFDCSGLTMTIYQLNGLNLPRHSMRQFDSGTSIDKDDLEKGDLVFFAKKGSSRVSHVGIYIGSGRFIHASSHGKKIRIDSLSADYFTHQFVGAKTYL